MSEGVILDRLAALESKVEKLFMRQEAVIAAIHKLASVIDTTNALVSEMAMWVAKDETPPKAG